MVYVLIAKDSDDGVEFKSIGAISVDHVAVCAEVSRAEGFDVMWTCSEQPDMDAVFDAVVRGNSVTALPFVNELHVLNEEWLK